MFIIIFFKAVYILHSTNILDYNMDNLDCSICSNQYDLDVHRPVLLKCRNHSVCLECFFKVYNVNQTYTCAICNSLFYEDASEYGLNTTIVKILQMNQVLCHHDDNAATNFNFETSEAECSDHGISTRNLKSFITIINSKLIADYLKHKNNLSFEMRRMFSFVVMFDLQGKLSYIYALKMYNNQLSSHYKPQLYSFEGDQNFYYLDPKRFVLYCKKAEMAGTNLNHSYLKNLFLSTLKKLHDENVMFLFTNVIKNSIEITDSYSKIFVELEYLNKFRSAIKLNHLSCNYCSKGFQVGKRMPLQMSCGHLICCFCLKTVNYCRFCDKMSERYDVYIDESLYTIPICKNCNNIVKCIPYHCICDCIYCETCISMNYFTSCGKCFYLAGSNYAFYLKVSKSALNLQHYLKIDITCFDCGRGKASFFDKKRSIVICSQCDRKYPENVAVRLIGCFNLDVELMKTYAETVNNLNPNLFFESLQVNSKLKIISELHSGLGLIDPNYAEIHELKLYSKIYPVKKEDRRVFFPKKMFMLKISLNAYIYLYGVVVSGRVDGKAIDVTVTIISTSGSVKIKGKAIGKFGYIYLIEPAVNFAFDVIIEYSEKQNLFSGFSGSLNVLHDNLNVTKSSTKQKYIHAGPLLSLLYSR